MVGAARPCASPRARSACSRGRCRGRPDREALACMPREPPTVRVDAAKQVLVEAHLIEAVKALLPLGEEGVTITTTEAAMRAGVGGVGTARGPRRRRAAAHSVLAAPCPTLPLTTPSSCCRRPCHHTESRWSSWQEPRWQQRARGAFEGGEGAKGSCRTGGSFASPPQSKKKDRDVERAGQGPARRRRRARCRSGFSTPPLRPPLPAPRRAAAAGPRHPRKRVPCV